MFNIFVLNLIYISTTHSDSFNQIKPMLHMAKTLGTQAGDFYELMTGPTSKILDKWFESDVLKVTITYVHLKLFWKPKGLKISLVYLRSLSYISI